MRRNPISAQGSDETDAALSLVRRVFSEAEATDCAESKRPLIEKDIAAALGEPS